MEGTFKKQRLRLCAVPIHRPRAAGGGHVQRRRRPAGRGGRGRHYANGRAVRDAPRQPPDAGRPVRPGTPDNAPVIGELRPGVLVATGHYRNGVLLAPVTADAVADLVTGGPDAELVKAYGPERFG